MTNSIKKLFVLPLALLVLVSIVAVSVKSSKSLSADKSHVITSGRVEQVTASGMMDRLLKDYKLLNVPSDDELVWTVVELESLSAAELAKKVNYKGALVDFLTTTAGKNQLNAIESEQQLVKARIQEALGYAEFKYSYKAISNGLAVQVRYGDLDTLKSVKGVKKVTQSITYSVDAEGEETEVNIQTLAGAKSNSKYRGQGMVVGILDTGLQTTHEAFSVMPKNPKMDLAYVDSVFGDTLAWLFSASEGEFLTGEDVYVNEKVPYAFDYADVDNDVNPDLATMAEYGNEHGTHVAGIVAGNNGKDYEGAAPEAQLAIFKVFSDSNNGAATIDLIAALNDAVILGVDTVNMSLGSPCGFANEDPEEMMYYNAVAEAGINLVTSAGNQYQSGLQTEYIYGTVWALDQSTLGSPASYASAFAVAAYATENEKSLALIIGGVPVIYNDAVIDQDTSETRDFVASLVNSDGTDGVYQCVYAGLGYPEDVAAAGVAGKVALVLRGEISFTEKAQACQEAGAAAVVIINNVGGARFSPVIDPELVTIPVCSISLADGQNVLTSGSDYCQIGYSAYRYGGVLDDFSSWGPGPNLQLKPEITSYGGMVYSSVPNATNDGYEMMSGTSMSSPSAAGNITVLKQAIREKFYMEELTDLQIAELTYQMMMSTATQMVDFNNNYYYPVRRQGAGLVNIDAAIETAAYLYVQGQPRTKLELGEDEDRTGVYKMKFTLKNISNVEQVYQLNPVVMTTNTQSTNPIEMDSTMQEAMCTFQYAVAGNGSLNGDVVTVAKGAEVQITVTAKLTEEQKALLDETYPYGTYIEGWVQLDNLQGEIDLSIPFLAFYGNWDALPMLDATIFDNETVAAYQSQPLGIYANRYLLPLGMFPFNVDENYAEPAPNAMKASLNPSDANALRSFYTFYMGLLRNASSLRYEFWDADTDTMVTYYTGENIRKSFYNISAGQYAPVAHTLNFIPYTGSNSTLKLRVVCYPETDEPLEATNNVYEVMLNIDAEAPKVHGMYVTAQMAAAGQTTAPGGINYEVVDGKAYVTLDVEDNGYLMCYYFSSYDQETDYTGFIPLEADKHEVKTIRWEITDLIENTADGSDAAIVWIYDYAMNYVGYLVEIPTREDLGLPPMEEMTAAASYTPEKMYGETPVEIEFENPTVDGTNISLYLDNEKVGMTAESFHKFVINAVIDNPAYTVTEAFLSQYTEDKVRVYLVLNTAPTEQFKLTVTLTNGDDSYVGSVRFNGAAYLPDFEINESGQLTKYNGEATTVVLPKEVKSIGASAFTGRADVTSITINKECTSINASALTPLTALEEIVVEEGNPTYVVEDDALYDLSSYALLNATVEKKAKEVYEAPSFMTNFGAALLTNAEKVLSATKLVVGPNIKTVAARAVTSSVKKFTEIEFLPNAEITFGSSYFMYSNTSVTKVTLPEGLTQTISYMFYGATKLTEVKFPSTLEYLAANTIYNATALTAVELPEGLKSIDTAAIYNTGITELNVPDTVAEISYNSFGSNKQLVKVTLGSCLQTIFPQTEGNSNAYAYSPFYNCTKLATIEIAENNKNFFVEDGVVYTADGAMLVCVASAAVGAEFTVPAGVVKVCDGAFAGTSQLKKVNFPASLAVIGDRAFYGCSIAEVSFLSADAPALLAKQYNSSLKTPYYYNFGSTSFVASRGYSPLKLKMTCPENGVGYDSFAYSMYFSTVDYIATRDILKVKNLDAKATELGILLTWEGTDLGAQYLITRSFNGGDEELVAVTEDTAYYDFDALALDTEYVYHVYAAFISSKDFIIEDYELAVTHDSTTKQAYLAEIIANIKKVAANPTAVNGSLVKNTYAAYVELSDYEAAQVGLGDVLEAIYADYAVAAEFNLAVVSTIRPTTYADSFAAYDALIEVQATLNKAQAAFVSCQVILDEWAQDLDAARNYIRKLQFFPNVTFESRAAIDELKADYAKLTRYQRGLVDLNYNAKIAEIESEYAKILNEIVSRNISIVIDLINALPEAPTTLDGAAIKAARQAYDSLTDYEKAEFPAELYTKLVACEKAVPAAGCTITLTTAIVSTLSALSLAALVLRKKNF